MKKVVKMSESHLEKLVRRILKEDDTNQANFLLKTLYNPNDKSITGSYYLLGENDRSWELLNIQEKEKMGAVWGDDAKVYTYQPVVFKLPKSQALMVEEIGNTGYFIFKIPYWLYKKEPNMQVKRLEGKKRFVQPDIKGLENLIPFQVLEPAMEAIGADMQKLKGMKVALDDYKNPKKPVKPEDKPGYIPSTFGNVTKLSGPERMINRNSDIVNESKLSDGYDQFDYVDAFFTVFRNWLKEKYPDVIQKGPLSYYTKKFGDEFSEEYNLHYNLNPRRDGQLLIDRGIIDLGNMRPEEKFTEKNKKTIPWIKSQFENDYTEVEITEDEPYSLNVKFIYDIPKLLKTDNDDLHYAVTIKRFNEILERYYGLRMGSPALGEMDVKFQMNSKGEEDWIKKEFSKLKKEIKQEFPSIKRISIKGRNRSPNFTVTFFRDYNSTSFRNTSVERIREFFTNKGYGKALTSGFSAD